MADVDRLAAALRTLLQASDATVSSYLHIQPTTRTLLSCVICNLLWSPYVTGQTIIFSSCFFFFLLLLFFPRLISAVEDWMFTILWHMVWP